MTPTADFGTEIMQYQRILRPFAFNLTHSMEESEDLIQDTFYRAIANKDKFSEGTNIKAWLFTIMKNIFINNYRKNQKKNVITDTSDNQYLLNSTKKVEHNGSEVNFLAADIEKAMQEVSADFTEPFMMYFNGFKYQEIAEQLNLPLGTVKSRIFFARKELQNRLKGMGISNSGFDK
jgi:RNA polymerase sigma-70 factor (ECF subfamily)